LPAQHYPRTFVTLVFLRSDDVSDNTSQKHKKFNGLENYENLRENVFNFLNLPNFKDYENFSD